MESAFKEYASITLKQKSRKPSMLDKLDKSKEIAVTAPVTEKVREKAKNMAR